MTIVLKRARAELLLLVVAALCAAAQQPRVATMPPDAICLVILGLAQWELSMTVRRIR